ncbi:ECF RNA polymerase sigma factor SigK [bacterium BMS3Abin03]|nr:ECF RNA polymerase sigma factor SigK [bacterium BMS3Abin03]
MIFNDLRITFHCRINIISKQRQILITYNTIPDNELFRKIAEYDSKALEELYDRYSPVLYTLIKRIVNDKNVADEVLSEIFVIIWRKVPKLNFDMNNVYVWLITLTRNKAVDKLKRNRNEGNLPEYSDEYEDKFILPRISNVIDQLDLKDAYTAKEKFEEALNKLTDAQQYVIFLAYYNGKTEKEIAEKLNIPLLTVKSKIHVALSNLKRNLLKEVEE